MNKELLMRFLGEFVRLIKDDDFVISGRIEQVEDDFIAFHTDGRTIILSFDRIKEIRPLRNQNRRSFHY